MTFIRPRRIHDNGRRSRPCRKPQPPLPPAARSPAPGRDEGGPGRGGRRTRSVRRGLVARSPSPARWAGEGRRGMRLPLPSPFSAVICRAGGLVARSPSPAHRTGAGRRGKSLGGKGRRMGGAACHPKLGAVCRAKGGRPLQPQPRQDIRVQPLEPFEVFSPLHPQVLCELIDHLLAVVVVEVEAIQLDPIDSARHLRAP